MDDTMSGQKIDRDNSVGGKKIDRLADISPEKDSWRVIVRIIRMWKVPAFQRPSETYTLEMVLIDEDGTKIHATVRKQLLYMFLSRFEEGGVYQMSTFSVSPNVGMYRSTNHPYKLIFQMKTKVHITSNMRIPNYGFSFIKMAEIAAHDRDYEYLVDVLGVVTGLSDEREYLRDGKITKMVVAELTDDSGKCECAMFGEYAEDLKKMIGKAVGGLPIVAVQFAKLKIFREKASLQNVINTTKVFVNPDISEVSALKEGLAASGVDCSGDVIVIGSRSKPSFDEEFLRMYPKKSIGQLLDCVEDGVFSVYGSISGLMEGQAWWYPACRCHSSVVADSGSYYCKGCDKHVFHIVPRFKVKVHVVDDASACVMLLFDNDMNYLFEKSCASFVAASKRQSSEGYPKDFDCLVGMKLLFIVDKNSSSGSLSDGSFKVKRVCVDPGVIERYLAEGFEVSPAKSVCRRVVDLDESDGCDDVEAVEETQANAFVDDLIVSPPVPEATKKIARGRKSFKSIKRNLSKLFDEVNDVGRGVPTKAMKLEKE